LYYPQALRWLPDLHAPLAGEFLKRWPTLPLLQKARRETLETFFHQHNCRSEELIRKRLEEIPQAVVATTDAAIVDSSVAMVRALVDLLAVLRTHIAALDREIAATAATHPELPILASLPGAGPVMVPRLIAALGTQRERFACASEVSAATGIAPVKQASGQSEWIHFRWACPKFLRQSFHEWAGHSLAQSTWAQAFYREQIRKGKGHHAAVRALAFKWQRILFRCWKDRRPYDEQRYLAAAE
jgi:transposase